MSSKRSEWNDLATMGFLFGRRHIRWQSEASICLTKSIAPGPRLGVEKSQECCVRVSTLWHDSIRRSMEQQEKKKRCSCSEAIGRDIVVTRIACALSWNCWGGGSAFSKP